MAERVVGTGSFGVVFQVFIFFLLYFVHVVVFCFTLPKVCQLIDDVLYLMQAKCLETGEAVAIKKVLQDKRYKNRELQVMRMVDHPNVVKLKHCFYSTTEKDELYLNLVLEYVPETVYKVSKNYSRTHQHMPIIYVQLYTYQVSL